MVFIAKSGPNGINSRVGITFIADSESGLKGINSKVGVIFITELGCLRRDQCKQLIQITYGCEQNKVDSQVGLGYILAVVKMLL
jgi:hypothetical protein